MTTSTISSQQEARDFGNSELKLKDIIKTLPRECFVQDRRKAWTTAIISVLMVGLGYLSLIFSPWFLLPVA